jgi:GNAT superfamily N-acetyltransferase
MTTVIDGMTVPSASYDGPLVTPVRPDDRAALTALFTRCSPETVRLRFFGGLQAFPRAYLDAVLAGLPDVHDAVVAYGSGSGSGSGDRTDIAGLASLATGPDRTGPGPRTAELGLLVADARQRQGAGTAMLGLLLARARTRGVEQVTATVLPGRPELLAALDRRPELERARLSRTQDGLTGVYRLDRKVDQQVDREPG